MKNPPIPAGIEPATFSYFNNDTKISLKNVGMNNERAWLFCLTSIFVQSKYAFITVGADLGERKLVVSVRVHKECGAELMLTLLVVCTDTAPYFIKLISFLKKMSLEKKNFNSNIRD